MALSIFLVVVLALHRCHGGSAATPVHALTTPTMVPVDLQQVADDANKMFHSSTGAAFRVIGRVPEACLDHSCQLWDLSHSGSFSILSNNSWSTKTGRYAVFPGLKPNNRIGGWPGMLLTAEAASSMRDCSFSGDGATGCREDAIVNGKILHKCGLFNPNAGPACKFLLGGPGSWCADEKFIARKKRFCVFPGTTNGTKWMLETYLKRGGGDLGRRFTDYCGYNEALVNRDKFDSALPKPIKAFVIPRECSPASFCYTNFTFWYVDFKKKHGAWPVIGFDGTRRINPYIVIPHPLDDSLKDSKQVISTIVFA